MSTIRGLSFLACGALVLSGCSGGDAGGSETATGSTETSANAGPGTEIPATYFGMQVGLLGGAPAVPTPETAGSIRLWDSAVSWREIEPEAGKFNWLPLDTAVERAQAMGAQDIMWVHGSTPQWAAQDPQAKGIYGPGTSSAPKEEAYLATLKAVATRYKGRIRTFQVWNEANIKIFYRGTPEFLAELTAKARKVLDEIDPEIVLVGASTTVRKNVPFKSFYEEYSAKLAQLGWPLDVMALHLYPLAEEGPETRASYIGGVKSWLAQRGWTGPLWDTEVNFGDRRDFAKKEVVIPAEQGAAYVARTYLDGLALGLGRAYWYTWNDHSLGIDMVDPATGAVLPPGQAYLTVQQWLSGGRVIGCTGEIMKPTGKVGAISTCQFQLPDGKPGQITWTHAGTTAVAAPGGTTQMCKLDGTCTALTAGSTFEVGTKPVLIRLG